MNILNALCNFYAVFEMREKRLFDRNKLQLLSVSNKQVNWREKLIALRLRAQVRKSIEKILINWNWVFWKERNDEIKIFFCDLRPSNVLSWNIRRSSRLMLTSPHENTKWRCLHLKMSFGAAVANSMFLFILSLSTRRVSPLQASVFYSELRLNKDKQFCDVPLRVYPLCHNNVFSYRICVF